MSLTLGLALLAALVLLATAVHGLWRVRRARPRKQEPAPGAATTTAPGTAEVDAVADTRPEPPPGWAGEPAAIDDSTDGMPPSGSMRRPARIDPLIDAVVTLTLEAPVSGEHVLASLPGTRRAGSKPTSIEGLDTLTGAWEPPRAGRRYGELQAGVQLANRSGALNEIEYSEFVQKMQRFADAVGGLPDFPDMLEVASRARELDAFAQSVDAQLTITLRSDAVAWSVGYVRQIAARHGFVAGTVPGKLVLPCAAEGEPPLLVLSFDSRAALAEDPQEAAVREVQLSLDVPQTPADAEAFPAWHNAARCLGDDLAATAVDDFGEPITLHAFNSIGQELQALYHKLEAHGLAAGSAAARRLFS